MNTETDASTTVVDPAAADTAAPVADGADAKEAPQSALDAFSEAVAQVDKEAGVTPVEADKPAEAAKPDDAKPAEAVKTPDDPAKVAEKAQVDAELAKVEDEIKGLQLKEAAAVRFRELSKRPKPEDVEKILEPMRARDVRLTEVETLLKSTGGTPEQFGAMITYIGDAVKANRGDLETARALHRRASDEAQYWARMIGAEAPGYDPLAEHPDLLTDVQDGNMPRERALELAQLRAGTKVQAQVRTQTEQQDAENRRIAAEEKTGLEQLNILNETLKSSDPQFADKLALIKPLLPGIRGTYPPAQWAARVQELYQQVRLPAPAPTPRATVAHMPIRPGGASNSQRPEPKNALDAFSSGVEFVSSHG